MLLKLGEVFKGMQERKRDERGFTLIELLVVVIIIGILAAIAIPTFLGQRERAQEASAVADVRNAVTAAETYGTGTSPSYNFSGMVATEMEKIEPQIEWKDGAAGEGQVGIVNKAAATNGGDRGTYTVDAMAANGTVFAASAATNGEVTYTRKVTGGTAVPYNP